MKKCGEESKTYNKNFEDIISVDIQKEIDGEESNKIDYEGTMIEQHSDYIGTSQFLNQTFTFNLISDEYKDISEDFLGIIFISSDSDKRKKSQVDAAEWKLRMPKYVPENEDEEIQDYANVIWLKKKIHVCI